MKTTPLLSLLAGTLLLFQSCKDKEKIPPRVSISSVGSISMSSVKASGFISFRRPGDVTAGYCYSTHQNPTTSDRVTQSSSILGGNLDLTITGLSPKTTYYIRAFVTDVALTGYSDQLTFTTQTFDLNYAKIYQSNSSYYYNPIMIFSVESGVHTVYGAGFNNAPITAKMVAFKNKADVVALTVTIVNDTTLTFQVPAEVLGQNPYIETKEYYVMLNEVLYNSQHAYFNKRIGKNGTNDTAIFFLNNKDLNIRKVVAYSESRCTTYVIPGRFASETTLGPAKPGSLLGVLARPASRRLIVKSGGQLLHYYPITNGSPTCGAAGILYEIYSYPEYPQTIYRFHDAGQVQLKEISLPTGVLTFQVENTMSDGSVVLSNEFSYTN